jgi:hypothetical protein
MIRWLLERLGYKKCHRCGHWAPRGQWAIVSKTAGPPPRIICWECREFEIYPGFQP